MPELQVLKTQICPRVSILTLRYKFSCYQASVILINTMKHALLICLFAGTFKRYSYAANTWQLTLAHSKETLNIMCRSFGNHSPEFSCKPLNQKPLVNDIMQK